MLRKSLRIQPDDSQTMYVAATILEKMPDDASQSQAIDYDTHLIDQCRKLIPNRAPANDAG